MIYAFGDFDDADMFSYHGTNRGRFSVDFGLGCNSQYYATGCLEEFEHCSPLSPTMNVYWVEKGFNSSSPVVSFMLEVLAPARNLAACAVLMLSRIN
jgi:hypothetical protein